MGKFIDPAVLDAALNQIATATVMVATNGQPASYAAANTGKLASAALTPADFTLAAGDVSGRKVTVAAKANVNVTTAGTADHISLLDPATSRLLYTTVCPSQALPAGGTVSFAAWAVEVNDPA